MTYLRVLRQSRQLVPWVEKDLDSPVDLPAKGRTVVAFDDDLIALQSERKRKVRVVHFSGYQFMRHPFLILRSCVSSKHSEKASDPPPS